MKTLPGDLGQAFDDAAQPMPRERLTAASWRFESDRLDAIRSKMAAERKTLAEVYGPPLYGIKTGLNEAFVLSRESHDMLIAADSRSAELLKPFLIGENLKRWHVESDDLWLIYTPKNRIDIVDYPAIRDHLAPFKAKLESRATQQQWWELQQAQAAYQQHFDAQKLIWPHFQNAPAFSAETTAYYLNNKCFFWPDNRAEVSAILNSKALWFSLFGKARAKRGGYLEAEAQYVGALPSPELGDEDGALAAQAFNARRAADDLARLIDAVSHRMSDFAPVIRTIAAFRAWPDLDFAALRALIVKRCKTDIPPGERDDWERWFAGKRAEAAALRAAIADAEAEINDRVYRLFGLDADEVALIEESLAGQY